MVNLEMTPLSPEPTDWTKTFLNGFRIITISSTDHLIVPNKLLALLIGGLN